MKIISKFKDFYDYKVAKYGVDEKIIYIELLKFLEIFPEYLLKMRYNQIIITKFFL